MRHTITTCVLSVFQNKTDFDMNLVTVVDVIPGNTSNAIFVQLGFNEADTFKSSLILIY
jgi:hypothetical protein